MRVQRLAEALRSVEEAFLIGVPGTTELWLIRHADCYQDAGPDEDPPLSEFGRRQAERLAERVSRLNVAAVYSSPHRRALETARRLAADVRVDQRLREQELQPDGSLSDFKEPPDAVLERMRAAVGDAAAAHPGGRVLLVTHALAILAYLCEVMRVEVGRLRLLPYYTSVSVVRIKGDRRMVGALADTSHLELD